MEINEIKSSQDVYKFMTNNIEYGWIDVNGNINIYIISCVFIYSFAIIILVKKMKETIIYLIRHSEQLKMNNRYLSGEDEQIKNEKIILSIEGERKAKELSKREELKNIDVLYSSNYVRAIATAKYIANKNNLNINIDDRLGERKLR